MSLLIVDPAVLQDVFQKLNNRIVTVESEDVNGAIVRTFHKLEFHEDRLFYYFAECAEEYVGWRVSKRKVDKFEVDLDSIVLHMSNNVKIIISSNTILDDIINEAM